MSVRVSSELTDYDRPDGQTIILGGLVSGLQRRITKQGNFWAMFTLEDLAGAIEVMCFPSAYQLCSTLLAEDAVLIVKGRLDRRDEAVKVIATEVIQPDLTIAANGADPVAVTMPVGRCTPPVVERPKEILVSHPGDAEVHFYLQNGRRTTVVRLDDKLRVTSSPSLMGDLKGLLGAGCLQPAQGA